MQKATDEQILALVNKYRDQINSRLIEAFKRAGLEPTQEVNEDGLWDELFCAVIDDEFLDGVVDSINDSVGADVYGFTCPDSDE